MRKTVVNRSQMPKLSLNRKQSITDSSNKYQECLDLNPNDEDDSFLSETDPVL